VSGTGRGWRSSGASGKHRGVGCAHGRRLGSGACAGRPGGGVRGWRPVGTTSRKHWGLDCMSEQRPGWGRGSGRAGSEHLWEVGGISQI
jgi:hypothetical protein